MSDTPRTDEAEKKGYHYAMTNMASKLVLSDFARQLERELSAVTKERDELKQKNAQLESLFDLQHKRCIEATRLWQKAHNPSKLIYPGLGQIIEWLIKRGDEAINEKNDVLAVLYKAESQWKKAVDVWSTETGNFMVMPELCDLIEWLLARCDEARAALKEAIEYAFTGDNAQWDKWRKAAGMDS